MFRKPVISGAMAVAVAASLVLTVAPLAGATRVGDDGCSPGYWKNHTDNWEEYTTSSLIDGEFMIPAELSGQVPETFHDALQGGGGKGIQGAAKILLRASTAAFLNAAHEGLGYPLRRDQGSPTLRETINSALASLDRDTMLDLAEELDDLNNLGCPLN